MGSKVLKAMGEGAVESLEIDRLPNVWVEGPMQELDFSKHDFVHRGADESQTSVSKCSDSLSDSVVRSDQLLRGNQRSAPMKSVLK